MPTTFDPPVFPDRRAYPWLHLLRAGGLACGWPQLAVSFLAAAVFLVGLMILRWSFPASSIPHDPRFFPTRLVLIQESNGSTTPALHENLLLDVANTLGLPWMSLRLPLLEPLFAQPSLADAAPQASRLAALITMVWSLAVWSLFGTALCRAVAAQIGSNDSESLPGCLRYASRRWFSAMGAPLILIVAIFVLAVGLIITAWLGRMPGLGSPMVTLLSPVLFLAGFTAAFFTLVILLGWPLMIAALGIEDCDAFGALSRGYSYLTGQPLLVLWQVFFSVLYGSLLTVLVAAVFTAGLMFLSTTIAGPLGSTERWALVMTGAHHTARLLLATFAVSLFWSLTTINYLLLRQAVDQKPIDEISPDLPHSGPRSDLPIVGIAATDFRQEDHSPQLITDN